MDSARVLRLARALALPAPAADIRGSARVSFVLADTWAGTQGPLLVGSASLRNITARIDGLASPLMIHSGRLVVSPASVCHPERHVCLSRTVSPGVRLGAQAAAVPADGTGFAREAGRDQSCVLAFRLAAGRMTSDNLARLLVAPKQHRPWYRLIRSGRTPPSPLMDMRAAGRLTAAALQVNSAVARGLRADVQWNRGILQLKHLQAQVWDGEQGGELTADFRGAAPAYEWNGELQQVALEDLSGSEGEDYLQPVSRAQGKATLTGTLKASGSTAAQLRASASGVLQVNWHKGVLQGLALDGRGGPLRFRALHGTVEFHGGEMKISEGWLQAPDGLYRVSGTAALARDLKIRLARVAESPQNLDVRPKTAPARTAEGYWITGPLDAPIVEEVFPAETAGPLASSKQEGQKPEVPRAELQKPDVQKPEVQKKEARNRNAAGRGAALVPANRE